MLPFFVAFIFVVLGMPSLIQLAVQKDLLDEPSEDRKIHKRSVPRLGGVLVFLGTLFTTCLLVHPEGDEAISFLRLAAGSLILFFLGLKDDLTGVNPIKKLAAQICVGCILILCGGYAITDFHNLFGWNELSVWFSPIFSLFVYIVVVNAVNLIDGIDTLAGGYGLLIAIACSIWFAATGQNDLATLCLALAGALSAFLVFNITPARIFLGDSGSLILGMFIYVMATSIIQTPTDQVPEMWQNRSLPILAMTTLSYPLVDTLRVFSLRLLKGKSPFSADRCHLHHRLLKLDMTHLQVALFIHGYTAAIVALGFWIPIMDATYTFFILLACAFTLPLIIIAVEKVRVLSRAVRRKEARQH